MEVINYDNIKETLYHEVLNNGLNVYIVPKEGYTKTYGLFSTKFGSVDTEFIPINENNMIKVPDGVAHFLEHKMFEMKDGDVSEKFAKLGASTNAFTSFARTCYLFNTVENQYDCINLLLDFVQELYITDESIEKEKGIINQEIGMYDDDPSWQLYFSSIQNLYHNHPVKIDIAGDITSVSKIYKSDLEKCYNTFYHPSNMMLFIVGNVDVNQCMKLIVDNQNIKSFINIPKIKRKVINEPNTVFEKTKNIKMDISMEQLILSIKVNYIPSDPKDRLKQELCCNLLLDILFSSSSILVEEWEKEGLINDTFGGSYTSERDYAFIQIGGESTKLDELEVKLNHLITNINDLYIDDETFNRIKKMNYGSLITLLNNPENIGNTFTKYYHDSIIFFDIYKLLESITVEDIQSILPLFDINNASITKLLKID